MSWAIHPQLTNLKFITWDVLQRNKLASYINGLKPARQMGMVSELKLRLLTLRLALASKLSFQTLLFETRWSPFARNNCCLVWLTIPSNLQEYI